jgi:hypothetical protein
MSIDDDDTCVTLTQEELDALIEKECQRSLGISRETFIQRYNDGTFRREGNGCICCARDGKVRSISIWFGISGREELNEEARTHDQ